MWVKSLIELHNGQSQAAGIAERAEHAEWQMKVTDKKSE
tara:strand:+ start:2505 stop:2621 length:117 start_codon:yes stop_codon:yes gene_type:complete